MLVLRFRHASARPNVQDMTTSRTALVTGATQGLGLALVEALAAQLGTDDLVLVTGRDLGRAERVVLELSGTAARVEARHLDVTDPVSVHSLGEQLGEVDLVVSNAGARISPDREPVDQVDLLAETNPLGAVRMLREFAPRLRPGGRFLVVASSFGTLGHLDPAVRPQVEAAVTLDDVEALVQKWRSAVLDGTAEEQGWPHWLNVPSMVLQVSAMRAVAAGRREGDLADGTLVAAVCPGLIDTDASRPWFDDMSQAQSPAEAAEAPLRLLLEPLDPATYGELVRFGEVLPCRGEIAPAARASARVSRSG